MVLFGVCCCVLYLCTGVHLIGEGDWSAAVTLPIFFLKFQQARERLRLFPEQPEGGQELPSERDANGEF